ncbi:MAG: allantoicase [Acidobacteria bacterium]|nr:allantoicase [Acidobacteriota bacterium]
MLTDFTQLVDLASERLGGVVLAANDEFFASKENLLKAAKPIFIEDRYTDRGKWMDGWETRRRRGPGHDWCVIRLGLPGALRGIVVDTSYFKGNYPSHCSLEVCAAPADSSAETLLSPETRWVEILPRSPLEGDAQNLFPIGSSPRVTHVRFNIFPDGGVARLRLHGEVLPDWARLCAEEEIDLLALAHGGRVLAASDTFFSAPPNLLLPGAAKTMGEGWETRRRRGPGHDWVILQLGSAGVVRRIEVDTAHFKGNFPESCSLEACDAEGASLETLTTSSALWNELLPRTPLEADKRHLFEVNATGPVTHIRFNIFPDGGVSRLRLYGTVDKNRWLAAGLQRLNELPAAEAEAALLACCGSANWSRAMLRRRPFASVEALLRASDETWQKLGHEDWLEAFSAHPRIGERKAGSEPSAEWSQSEQSSAAPAGEKLRAALAEANRAYEARFGHIFIVCATRKTAEEMLALLRQRLHNDPAAELRIAAEEQRRITALRLEKLLLQ